MRSWGSGPIGLALFLTDAPLPPSARRGARVRCGRRASPDRWGRGCRRSGARGGRRRRGHGGPAQACSTKQGGSVHGGGSLPHGRRGHGRVRLAARHPSGAGAGLSSRSACCFRRNTSRSIRRRSGPLVAALQSRALRRRSARRFRRAGRVSEQTAVAETASVVVARPTASGGGTTVSGNGPASGNATTSGSGRSTSGGGTQSGGRPTVGSGSPSSGQPTVGSGTRPSGVQSAVGSASRQGSVGRAAGNRAGRTKQRHSVQHARSRAVPGSHRAAHTRSRLHGRHGAARTRSRQHGRHGATRTTTKGRGRQGTGRGAWRAGNRTAHKTTRHGGRSGGRSRGRGRRHHGR